MKGGVASGLVAYGLWGLLPIYWKALARVPSFEILCHRTWWACVFMLVLFALRRSAFRSWRAIWPSRALWVLITTAFLLAVNWFTYIWAVNNGFILEASLGYYINPLVNVFLGALVLRERLRRWQWAAVAIAAIGVGYATWSYGSLPWIALTLAFTFGFYGLLRKIVAVGAIEGFAVEATVLAPAGLVWLVQLELTGGGAFGHGGAGTSLLLAAAGPATAMPLLFFAHAANRVTLATLGILQYVAPTLHLLLGTLVYGEDLTPVRIITFVAIWIALAIYTLEGVQHARRLRWTPTAASTDGVG